jgi:hypothetical protein
VHRVLKPEHPLVFSLPHPAYDMIDDDADPPLLIRRSYFDRTPIEYERGGVQFTDYRHTISDLFASLSRANFRIDTLLEPEPVPDVPRSQHWRPTYASVPRHAHHPRPEAGPLDRKQGLQPEPRPRRRADAVPCDDRRHTAWGDAGR